VNDPGPGGTGCRDGHRPRPSPVEDPELGLVPSRTATVLGGLVIALVCAALAWWVPAARPWIPLVLALWGALTLAVQAALGHRGRCLARRTVRWWLGPPGALLDPTGD
jgi:hypothetical protein